MSGRQQKQQPNQGAFGRTSSKESLKKQQQQQDKQQEKQQTTRKASADRGQSSRTGATSLQGSPHGTKPIAGSSTKKTATLSTPKKDPVPKQKAAKSLPKDAAVAGVPVDYPDIEVPVADVEEHQQPASTKKPVIERGQFTRRAPTEVKPVAFRPELSPRSEKVHNSACKFLAVKREECNEQKAMETFIMEMFPRLQQKLRRVQELGLSASKFPPEIPCDERSIVDENDSLNYFIAKAGVVFKEFDALLAETKTRITSFMRKAEEGTVKIDGALKDAINDICRYSKAVGGSDFPGDDGPDDGPGGDKPGDGPEGHQGGKPRDGAEGKPGDSSGDDQGDGKLGDGPESKPGDETGGDQGGKDGSGGSQGAEGGDGTGGDQGDKDGSRGDKGGKGGDGSGGGQGGKGGDGTGGDQGGKGGDGTGGDQGGKGGDGTGDDKGGKGGDGSGDDKGDKDGSGGDKGGKDGDESGGDQEGKEDGSGGYKGGKGDESGGHKGDGSGGHKVSRISGTRFPIPEEPRRGKRGGAFNYGKKRIDDHVQRRHYDDDDDCVISPSASESEPEFEEDIHANCEPAAKKMVASITPVVMEIKKGVEQSIHHPERIQEIYDVIAQSAGSSMEPFEDILKSTTPRSLLECIKTLNPKQDPVVGLENVLGKFAKSFGYLMPETEEKTEFEGIDGLMEAVQDA